MAVRLSTLSTSALIGTSTLPASRNSSTNVATTISPIASGRRSTIDALVSTSSAAGPPTNDVAVVGVEAANRRGTRRSPSLDAMANVGTTDIQPEPARA